MRTLGRQADEWNMFAQHLPEARSKIEREMNRRLVRDYIGHLDGTEFRILCFIIGRTLGWQKFAEAIPMSHFRRGLVEPDGALSLGEEGRPYCSGVGLRKEETIRSAVQRLEHRGLITTFPGRPGTIQPANVYLPFSVQTIAQSLIDAGSGVLPKCAPVTIGEHVFGRNAVWSVCDVSKGQDRVGLVCVSSGDNEAKLLPAVEFSRIPLDVWRDFRGDTSGLAAYYATRRAA